MKHVHAEVIKAWADDTSLDIQCRLDDSDNWNSICQPEFHSHRQYRIKPQPKAISWTNMYKNGASGWTHSTKIAAENEARERSDRSEHIATVEVRDDGTAHLHKVES